MKIILSRKGFDSEYGRVPSPILPDGRMVSLPIPDKHAPTVYDSIRRDELAMTDLIVGLGAKRGKPSKPIAGTDRAHLDPDLDHRAVPRPEGWRPIFGQSDAALGHLTNEGVGIGDLFLFFGWFRPAQLVDGRWCYLPGSTSVHALWGWLRVGGMYLVNATLPADIRRWAAGHPHLQGPQPPNNTVIVADDEMVVAGRRLPGSGIFRSAPQRVLTEPDSERRGSWRMPAWMLPQAGHATLSYHGDRTRWTLIDEASCRLRAVDKGQEFVLDCQRSDLLDQWLASLFSDVGRSGLPPAPSPTAGQ